MKKLYRVVNYEDLKNNKNDYYCEYSLDGGKTWKVEQIYFTFKHEVEIFTISEDILWLINKNINLGYKFIGVISSKRLED